MSAPVRLGLAGCGRLAERGYLPALAGTHDLELRAAADPDRERWRLFDSAVPVFASVHEMLEAGGLDAVVLATPADGRLRDSRLAAEAGVLALVEKPPAASLADARGLAELTPQPRVGFNCRFEPALEAFRSRLPRDTELQLDLRFDYRRDGWAPHVVDDDALADIGSHLLDLVRWLSGMEPRKVSARSLTRHHAELALELDRGRALVSTATDRQFRRRFSARRPGERTVVAEHREGGTAANVLARLRRSGAETLVDSLRRELEALAAAVRGLGAEPLASAADGAAVMAVIDAARRSAAEDGSWVEIT